MKKQLRNKYTALKKNHPKMTRTICAAAILISILSLQTPAQSVEVLRQKIEQIISKVNADVGIAISGKNSNDTISINGNKHYPMQSVFKFHIAIAILAEVDKGNLSLNQKIEIDKNDLLPETWSPMRELYPNGGTLNLADIIKYTVSQSDNNGCDILLRLVGGAEAVNKYFQRNAFTDISIQVNEEEMHKDWDTQFKNWTTPLSANSVLHAFFNQQLLSRESNEFLWKVMTETSTGKKRIRGQIPDNAIVAHKTGTSDTNEQGITAALNDIGIVMLPDGKYFMISVFISNSSESQATNEKIIADAAKLAWDYYSNE